MRVDLFHGSDIYVKFYEKRLVFLPVRHYILLYSCIFTMERGLKMQMNNMASISDILPFDLSICKHLSDNKCLLHSEAQSPFQHYRDTPPSPVCNEIRFFFVRNRVYFHNLHQLFRHQI